MHDQFSALWEHDPRRQDDVDRRTVAARHAEKRGSRPVAERCVGWQHARKRPTPAIQLIRNRIDQIETVRDPGPWRRTRTGSAYWTYRCGDDALRVTDEAELLRSVTYHPPTVSRASPKDATIGRPVDARLGLWKTN